MPELKLRLFYRIFMMKKRVKRIWWYIFILLVLISTGYLLIVFVSGKSPVKEANLARQKIITAQKGMAGSYAAGTLREAENLFQQSVAEWKQQNEKFFLFRDYSHAGELAIKSAELAENAFEEASASKEKLKQNVQSKLNNLEERIGYFEKYYEDLALTRSVLSLFNAGKTRFLESEIEFNNNRYMQALKLIYQAEESISRAEKTAYHKLVDFFNDYPVWEKNTRLAYNLSKKVSTVLLVDKISSALIVIRSGKDYKIFPAEFGSNWMGDKFMVGDKATPEGIYKVKSKRRGSATKYYKALLLNYPNNEDQKHFAQMVRSGKIPKTSGIGGMIEVHGEGGKGIHWTDGCIALENSDMDTVYSLCGVDTPVIIIGSREPLEEYLKD